MPRLLTTDVLISNVRSLLDEVNTDAIDDTADIIPALNRAQMEGFNILARLYPEPILKHATLTLTGGTQEYDMPENVFEDRIEKIQIYLGNVYADCKRISYYDTTFYESATTSPIPAFWTGYGRKIRFLPTPDGSYQARLWYLEEPEQLVKSQGRVTTVSVAGNYVVVDSIGADLTTTDDNLNNYVNIIDGQTGIVKATMQISNIVGNKIAFRAVPSRPSGVVLNRTISTAIPTTVNQDDYVCVVSGTCVPLFAYPTSQFVIDRTVLDMKGVKLSEDSSLLEKLVEKFEGQLKHSWAGRETTKRITKRSRPFSGVRGRGRLRL
jgi:hypothetical protein